MLYVHMDYYSLIEKKSHIIKEHIFKKASYTTTTSGNCSKNDCFIEKNHTEWNSSVTDAFNENLPSVSHGNVKKLK